MRDQCATPDQAIAELAARQHGPVSVAQLNLHGLDKRAVYRRVKSGRLHPRYRGVYAVGHRDLSNEGEWMAAVLACGDDAVLSHRSAAEHWGLLPPRSVPIDVTTRRSGGRRHRGIRVHRSSSLTQADTMRHKEIPVTTPARTIRDLRRVASIDDVRRAIRQAEFKGLDLGNEGNERELTRSALERRFLKLCHLHRFPRPEVNAIVEGIEVDFLWREHHLVVEMDGYDAHRGRVAFEVDRARDLRLRSAGLTVVRLTSRQLTRNAASVAGSLLSLLRVVAR